jgi:hypothetical protein
MRRQLTGEEYAAKLRTFEHTAFRLETQTGYAAPAELELVAEFEAGNPRPADQIPALRDWFNQVRAQVAQGKRIERVRVHDEPPTPYQRLERWADKWNRAAGETIRYLTRRRAEEIGLLPAAGTTDWWLLDSRELLVLTFGDDRRISRRELVTDPAAVVQAAVWRDLAVHHGELTECRHPVA